MKKILLPLLLVFSTGALASTSQNGEASPIEQELKAMIESSSGGKEYEWKSSTQCNVKGLGSDVVYSNLKPVSYYICPDKTISHVQPPSTGLNGWEGYCGQTAMSNITSMLCGRHMSPKSNDFYGTDLSPGQHSTTILASLRKIFTEYPKKNTCPKVTWKIRQNWRDKSLLKSVKGDVFGSTSKIKRFRSATTYVNITPTPVLLNSGGLNYHWVTVVDFLDNKNDEFGCDVVLNTWGDQKTLTCENFVSYTDHSGLGERVSLGFD